MKVLPHRYHLSAELRNQLSVTHQKLGATPSCFYKEKIQCRKQLQKLVAAPSTPQAGNYKTPLTVHNSSVPTTYLPIESTEATVTVPDLGGPEKTEARQFLLTNGLNQQNAEVGKFASKAKSLILRQYCAARNIAELIPAPEKNRIRIM